MKSRLALLLFVVFIISCDTIDTEKKVACLLRSYKYTFDNNSSNFDYEYNEIGKIKSISWRLIQNDKEYLAKAKLIYDEKGRLVQIENNSENHVEISYNGNVRTVNKKFPIPLQSYVQVETHYLNDKGLTTNVNNMLRYEYNSSNQAIKIFRTYSNSETLQYDKQYDKNPNPLEGLEVSPAFYSLNGTNIVLFFDYTFSNCSGNLIQQKNYDNLGKLNSVLSYSYTYTPENYPLTSTITESNGKNYFNYTYECE